MQQAGQRSGRSIFTEIGTEHDNLLWLDWWLSLNYVIFFRVLGCSSHSGGITSWKNFLGWRLCFLWHVAGHLKELDLSSVPLDCTNNAMECSASNLLSACMHSRWCTILFGAERMLGLYWEILMSIFWATGIYTSLFLQSQGIEINFICGFIIPKSWILIFHSKYWSNKMVLNISPLLELV